MPKSTRSAQRVATATVLPNKGPGPKTYIKQSYFTGVYQHRILIGIPTMGVVRIEWHNAVNGLVIPVNWSNSMQTPIGFPVADSQNIICKEALDKGFEWLFLLEDDTIPPPDLLVRLERYMEQGDIPIVSGLYALKSTIPMPFIFRGRGNGSFKDFTVGDLVWADGVPTGCLLIHMSVIRAMAAEAEDYHLRANQDSVRLKRIFWTPRQVFSDAALSSYQKLVGTSDLFFCDQLREKDILRKAGWGKIARRQYPYLVDTGINCGHIDRSTGAVYMIGRTGHELR